MLELRPNCELCDRDLPVTSADARICTYECTFCADCGADVLQNVCPNCGGGFAPRPIRPATAHRAGISAHHQPASTKRAKLKWTRADLAALVAKLSDTPPNER